MSTMLPIFYGEVPDTIWAQPEYRPDESGPGPESGLCKADDRGRGVKRKRVLTEARKEQNRAAQRVFRQRQRQRRQQQTQEFARQARQATQPELRPRVGDSSSEARNRKVDVEGSSSSGDLRSSTSTSSPDDVFNDEEQPVNNQLTSHPAVMAVLRATTPDPMANALEFLPTTVFGACLHNALALGMNLTELGTCGPEGISPFYQPSTPADDPTELFSHAMLSLSRKPPPNLLPTLTQILIPHHPSFDLIPLPHLRDQAIMLGQAMPEVFNVWELKLDIYQRGGLVMLNRRTDSAGRTRSCQPWEKSSWVAQPWFLRRWSMVVVGEREQLSKAVPCEEEAGC